MPWSKLYEPLLKQLGLWGLLNIATYLFFHYGIYFILPFKKVHSYNRMNQLFSTWESRGLIRFLINLPQLMFGKWSFFTEHIAKESSVPGIVRALFLLEILTNLIVRRLVWLPVYWTFQLATAYSLWSQIGFPNLNKFFELFAQFEPEIITKIRKTVFKFLSIDDQISKEETLQPLEEVIEKQKTLFDYFKNTHVTIKDSFAENTASWWNPKDVIHDTVEIGEPEELPVSYTPFYKLWAIAFGSVLLIGLGLYVRYRWNQWSTPGPSYDGFDPSNPGYTEYQSGGKLKKLHLARKDTASVNEFNDFASRRNGPVPSTSSEAVLSAAPVNSVKEAQISALRSNQSTNMDLSVNTTDTFKGKSRGLNIDMTTYQPVGDSITLPKTVITLDGISIDRTKVSNSFHAVLVSQRGVTLNDYLSKSTFRDDEKSVVKTLFDLVYNECNAQYPTIKDRTMRPLDSFNLFEEKLDILCTRGSFDPVLINTPSSVGSSNSEAPITPSYVKDNSIISGAHKQSVNRSIRAHGTRASLGLDNPELPKKVK